MPRIRHVAGSEIPLRSYEALHGERAVNDLLLTRVLYGISCRNYEAAAEAIPGRSGCRGRRCPVRSFRPARRNSANSRSGTSPGRTLWPWCWTARRSPSRRWSSRWASPGDKRFLGFVETGTENEKVLTPFLRSLVERGLDVSQGLLVIVDGGKGLRAAVRQAFRHRALVQRCQWHKRENVGVGLIRSRGHFPKGGYDVPDGATNQESAPTPAV